MNNLLTIFSQNILRFIVGYIVTILFFGNFATAQNFQFGTGIAKLSDLDNNGFANLGDQITPLSISLDAIPNDGTDSIHVAVVFGYYGNTDTLYLTKSGGTAGGGKGNNVLASYGGGANILTTPAFAPGLNGINANSASIPSNGIFRFLLFKKTSAPITASAGPKTILQTIDIKLVGDGLSSTPFNNIVDNIIPTLPVASDSLTVTDNAPTAFRAGIGDGINLRVDTLGSGGITQVYAQFNTNTDRDNAGVISTALLQNQTLGSGSTKLVRNNIKQLTGTTSFVGTIILGRGNLDIASATSNLGLQYYVVDAAGNVAGPVTFENSPKAIDNKISDLYTVSGSDSLITTISDSLSDANTDGIVVSGGLKSYIIGSKVVFKYTEPAAGNVQSVSISLTPFGNAPTIPMTYSYQTGGGNKVFLTTVQTFVSTNTDANLNTIKPVMSITDSAGNIFAGGVGSFGTTRRVDLTRPSSGSLSIALSISSESTIGNNIANGGEQLRAIISGLNVDNSPSGGYRIFAANQNLNTTLSGAQRNLITESFLTTGQIDGGGFQTISTTGTPLSLNYNVGTYNTASVPAGLNISANANSGRTLFIVRDEAGNEDTVSAVMPFAVNNITPATPQTATYTLQYDANGNNVANIGDSVKITVSGSGADANIASVYARVQSTIFGSVGQQTYTDIDRFGTDLANDDGGGDGVADYIKLTKVGPNYVTVIPVISSIASEFVGQAFAPGAATLGYHIIDAGGNNQSGFALAAGNVLTTSALTQRFDNVIPVPSTFNITITTSNPNGAFNNTNYITVGSTVIITAVNAPADVDTVFVDLRPLGLTANEALLKTTLNVIGNATKTFVVQAASSAYMDYPSTLDSARIPITMRDQSGNISVLNTRTISTMSGSVIRAIDRNVPIAIAQNRVTIIHTDYDAVAAITPSDNNGKINVGERVRILIDVSNQRDFFTANLGTGSMVVDLTTFNRGVQTVLATTAAPSPGLPGDASTYGYDPATNKFVFDFDVANNGADNLAPGSVGIIIRNLIDNAGNQTNPTGTNTLYTNLTIPQAIDAQQPTITIPSNSFAFSSSTDVNGDAIAAIGDGVTINAVVNGADSVFADLRRIGRGIVPMTLGSGNTWSITSTTVLQGNDPQWSSDNDFGNTQLNIIAQDINGNQSNALTAFLAVDNVVTKAPTMTVSPISGGRFSVRIEDGQNTITTLGTSVFSTDMSGGSVPNTSLYQIYFDSTGTGTFSLAGTLTYANPATFTSSQVFSNGKVVSFRVVPLDDAGNTGETSITGTAVSQIILPPVLTYEPADQTIIGSTAISIRARIDSANIAKVTAITFKSRAIDSDPGTNGNQPGAWFTVGSATQAGGVWTFGGITAGTFTSTPAVGNAYQLIAVLTDNASNVQSDIQALAANGSITIYADNQRPTITLSSVLYNGVDTTITGLDNNTPSPFLDIKARGIVAFRFTVTDNLPLNNTTTTIRLLVNATLTVNPAQTISSLIASGMVSVSGNIYTVRFNTIGYQNTNPTFGIEISDGRGNINSTFGNANNFGYNFQFSVADDVQPAYYLIQPFAGATFGATGFTAQLGFSNAAPVTANGWTEAVIQLSTTAAFTSPIHIGTSTIGNTTAFTLPIPSTVTLVSGTKYYVRAIVRDAVGNTTTTDPNMVYYDISTPTFTVSFPNAITVGEIPKVTGSSAKLIIASSTNDLPNPPTVRIRRIDRDTTTYTSGPFSQIFNANPYNYSVNFNGFFPSYDGWMVLEISGTDAAGNSFPAQYSTVYVDNRPTDYIITSVNGDDELASFTPMVAGDTLTVQFQVKSDDVASGEFFINSYGSGGTKVLGSVSARNGRNFTVKFPIPTDAANQTVSMNPTQVGGGNDFTAIFRDSLNNATGAANYIGFGASGTAIGTLTIINNAQLSILISNIQRGWTLSKTFQINTRTTATTASFSGVRFEIKRPGNTTFELLPVGAGLNPDNIEPYQALFVNSTFFVDGLYVLRAVALTNNGNTEAAFDTLTVMFDNSNNNTTDRATIVNLNNVRIGGGAITLSASAGIGVARVQFQSRFMSPPTGFPVGWQNLGVSSVPNAPNTFSITLTAQEIATAYTLAITQLDGRHEFRAVAEDNAGFAYYLFNNPTATMATPGFNTVGNIDDANEVANTTATIDVTAPTGVFNLAGVPLTTTQANSYSASTFNTMNVIDGSTTVRASVTDTSDFGQALVTLQRFGVRNPGVAVSAYGEQEGIEKDVATYTSASAIQYTVNSASLVRGGLYRMQIKLRDNLRNENTIQSFDFIAGKPQATVVGYNAEQKALYVLGQNHAQSAKVEYSINNGASYSEVNTLSLTQFGTGTANLDAARNGSFSLANIALPAGQVVFRVTASEQAAGQFSQSRFASAPTYFKMTVAANGSWSLSNLATAGVGILLNRQQGRIDSIRVEAVPALQNDAVALFMYAESNPFNSIGQTLATEYFPKHIVSSGNLFYGSNPVLISLDNQAYGFAGNSFINLSSGTPNISTGGYYTVFASVVKNDSVDLNYETFSVSRVAANSGGTITSSKNNATISFPVNSLTRNTGLLFEDDPAKLVPTLLTQTSLGQISSAVWLNVFGSVQLRTGTRATITMNYSNGDVVDANKDGVINGLDELMISVGILSTTTNPVQSMYTFPTDIRNKFVDTVNNVVSFTITSLSGPIRYTLLLDGANQTQQGSIILSEFKVGSNGTNNFIAPPSLTVIPQYLYIEAADNFSGFRTTSPSLYIDNIKVAFSQTPQFVDSNKTIRIRHRFASDFVVDEGAHKARFIIENYNGNRLDKSIDFFVDGKSVLFIGSSASILANRSKTISFILKDFSTQSLPGSGVDPSTVFVDIYANEYKFDSSGNVTYTKEFLYTLSPGQLTFTQANDSLKISFNFVDNFTKAQIDGYEFTVYDGSNNSTLSDSSLTKGGSAYSKGVRDYAGNVSTKFYFRVSSDNTPPTITLLKNTIEGPGVRLKIVDISGIDTSSIVVSEINTVKRDTVISTLLTRRDILNFTNDILSYLPVKNKSYITVLVKDNVGNLAIFEFYSSSTDSVAPSLVVISKNLDSGVKIKIFDKESGVDTLTFRVVEIDNEKKDSTVTTVLSSGITYHDSILTYSPKNIGNTVKISVSDRVGNVAKTEFITEESILSIKDFHTYPNPFNPEAKEANVFFRLSRTAMVSIEVFDWLGRTVSTVIDRQLVPAGISTGIKFSGRLNGSSLANGVYFLKITAVDLNKTESATFKAVIAVKK